MTNLVRRLTTIMCALVALHVFLNAPASTGYADDREGDPDDLITSIDSGPVCWEYPNPADPCQVTVRLSHRVRVAVTFSFATVDGTAVATEDYRRVVDRLTIPAGELTTDVALWVESDDRGEGEEWLYATISEPSHGQIGIGRSMIVIMDGGPPADR